MTGDAKDICKNEIRSGNNSEISFSLSYASQKLLIFGSRTLPFNYCSHSPGHTVNGFIYNIRI